MRLLLSVLLRTAGRKCHNWGVRHINMLYVNLHACHLLGTLPPLIWICIRPHLVCVFVTSPSRFSFVSCFFSVTLSFSISHSLLALVPVCILSCLSCFLQDIKTAGFIIKYTVYRKYFPPMTNIGVLHPVDLICALWVQTENTCQMTSAVWLLNVPRDVLFFCWQF